jgi:hypothetical protein
MTHIDLRRRRALGGLLGLPVLAGGALSTGCASSAAVPAPAGAEPLPVPKLGVGDRWRYRLIDRYNGAVLGETTVEVVAITPDISLRVDPGGGRPVLEERWADPWTVLIDTTYDFPLLFETPVPVVPPGARAGQGITTASRYRSERSSSVLGWQQRLRVVGWERVQVPAGTFEALRIERFVTYQHPDVFRYAPERTDTLWYAPQVRRWVAREWTGSYLPGAPGGRASRALEDSVRWELTGWQPAPG